MKKLFFGLICASFLLAAVGCGTKNDTNTGATNNGNTVETGNTTNTDNTSDEANNNAQENTQTGNETANAEEFTFVHSKGETTVKLNPSKVVVFDMGILDIMDALGIEAELAAPVSSVPEYLSKYANVTNAGNIKEPDLEAIFSFEPDVIFISGRQSDYYDELNKIAPTVYVDLEASNYMEDFEKNVNNIAALFGKTAEAEAKLQEIETRISEIKEVVDASDKTGLIVLVNDGNISAYGSGSRFGLIHDVLGVKQADANIEVSTHGQSASYEYIADVNPDILFVVDRTAVVGGTASVTETLNNELVNGTNAAKNDKIISLDPEAWYLAGGGLTSVLLMVNEVGAAFQ